MSRDQSRIYAAAFLRTVGVGLLGVLFALYLSLRGLHVGQIGLLVAVGLAGSVVGTFFVSFWADRIGRRRMLLLLSAFMALGGLGLVLLQGWWALTAACFIGMANAFGRERGAISTLEQAILPETEDDQHRTRTLAWYNVVLNSGLALGSLFGGLPVLLHKHFGMAELVCDRWTLFLYVACMGVSFLLYAGLSPRVEIHGPTPWHRVSPESRRILTRISLLFGFDSLAGGFLPGSLMAYWFFKRFGVGGEILGPLFFAGHLANALSYLSAVWLSRRIGLIRTMVFTHTPANLCLLALPFVPTLPAAVLLYLVRECLVEMDLPTRQSYVLAVVRPEERTIASGVTNLTRLAAWTAAPTFAGLAMSAGSLSLPLFLGGGMKILYDGMLFLSFRHVHPPEERGEC